jgi:hypothetical protein
MARPPFDAKAAAQRVVARTRAAQGLPSTIEDPVILRRIAVLMDVPKRAAS